MSTHQAREQAVAPATSTTGHDMGIATPYGVGNASGSWLAYCGCGWSAKRDNEQRARIAALAHHVQVAQAAARSADR